MTNQQRLTVEAVIDAAINDALKALPGGSDEELRDWIMAHKRPRFRKEITEALAEEGLNELIRDVARKLGVTLAE